MPRLALLLVLLGVVACGPDAPPAGRFAVVERGLEWSAADPDAPRPPLSRVWPWTAERAAEAGLEVAHWGGSAPAGAGQGPGHEHWKAAPRTAARLDPIGLLCTAEESVVLLGPPLDAGRHHHLVVAAECRGAGTLVVQWRGPGEGFHAARTWRASLDADAPEGEVQQVVVPVSQLRGARHQVFADGQPTGWVKGRDAAEGVTELRLAFEAAADESPVRVRVEELAYVSDFDQPVGTPLSVGREGIYRESVALRGEGLTATVRPGPWDRLRLALAVTGADAPQEVVLDAPDGGLAERRWTLDPEADWLEAVVDLAPLEGDPARLRLTTSGPGVVTVGSVMRLAPADDDPPPILLYLEDTVRADRLGTYGYARGTDPHLQHVASRGVVFERAFATSNWTRPATSSVLTGLDTLTHANNGHADRVAESVVTLAEALADAGYVTTSYITNYNAGEWAGLAQGMDVYREPTAYGATHTPDSLTSSILAGPVDEFLREHRDERVFVYVHTVDPHAPYMPPVEDIQALAADPVTPTADPTQTGTSKAYDGEVRHNDRWLAHLDETLTELGLLDDTLFAFLSDHGEAFGEHGTLEHRNTLFNEEMWVPFVLRWPAGVPGGQRHDEPVSQIDLAPTLLGLAGLEVPASWQGRDLSDALRGGRWDDAPLLLHTLHSAPKDGLSDEVAVVWGAYKLIAGLTPDGELVPRGLYHLLDDPEEDVDLRGRPETADVQKRLVDWGTDRVERSRAASRPARADEMDPAQRDWMHQMGYLGKR